MRPFITFRRHWWALASLAAATALMSIPGEPTRPHGHAVGPLLPGAAVARPSRGALAAQKHTTPVDPPGPSGRVVALDPETGQLGAPSPEQIRSFQARPGIAAVSRTAEGLVETRLADGTVILDLGGRFQDHVIARLDRSGRLVYGCIHDDGTPLWALPDTLHASALEER